MRIVTNALHWWFLQVPQMVHHLGLVRAAAPPSIPPKKTKNERSAANGWQNKTILSDFSCNRKRNAKNKK